MNIIEAINKLHSHKRGLELDLANAIEELLDDFTEITQVRVKEINVRLPQTCLAPEKYTPVVEVDLSI